jgi:hypothetical protein
MSDMKQVANLNSIVKAFALKWGPPATAPERWHEFVRELRETLNLYANAALLHGALPEKGVPHRWQEPAVERPDKPGQSNMRSGRQRKGKP